MNKLFNDCLGNLYYILDDLNASENQKNLVKSLMRKLKDDIGSEIFKNISQVENLFVVEPSLESYDKEIEAINEIISFIITTPTGGSK